MVTGGCESGGPYCTYSSIQCFDIVLFCYDAIITAGSIDTMSMRRSITDIDVPGAIDGLKHGR